MTKVYVVWQFDTEPYESYHDGIHSIFSSKEKAEVYIKEFGRGPHWIDEPLMDGYYLMEEPCVWEVQ